MYDKFPCFLLFGTTKEERRKSLINVQPYTIGGINKLSEEEKREIYSRYIPPELTKKFHLGDLAKNLELLRFRFAEGSSDVEMRLYHEVGFPDPILYAHLADSIHGQIFILLYILNDPASPRFDVDKMPDGSPTHFGIRKRNLDAERSAMEAGLAPGQIRHGLRALRQAIQTFEEFITYLGHDMYYIEPLYYHNAVIFERYGFSYQMGRKLMNQIHAGFVEGGVLHRRLDDSNPFRSAHASTSVRLRSWAIHDGILGEPFTNVTMYKRVGVSARISTTPGCEW